MPLKRDKDFTNNRKETPFGDKKRIGRTVKREGSSPFAIRFNGRTLEQERPDDCLQINHTFICRRSHGAKLIWYINLGMLKIKRGALRGDTSPCRVGRRRPERAQP